MLSLDDIAPSFTLEGVAGGKTSRWMPYPGHHGERFVENVSILAIGISAAASWIKESDRRQIPKRLMFI